MIADRPEIFPINYVIDHGTVVFRTAEGTKLAGAVQRDVALEVDAYHPDGPLLRCCVPRKERQVGSVEEFVPARDLLPATFDHDAPGLALGIVPDEITGHRFRTVDHEA